MTVPKQKRPKVAPLDRSISFTQEMTDAAQNISRNQITTEQNLFIIRGWHLHEQNRRDPR